MSATIKDKSVLITGAGRGIGKRLAMGFAQAGARVGLLARSQPELDLAKLEIEQAGGNALRIRADVRDLEQMAAAVDRMRVVFGGLDVLIAAAGVPGPIGPLLSTKPAAWNEAVQVNLIGVANTCRAALPPMVEKRSGKVILIAGAGASISRPNFTAYASSKAAVVRFAECLADEVRDDNVQVNAMIPGGSYTYMTDEILHSVAEQSGGSVHWLSDGMPGIRRVERGRRMEGEDWVGIAANNASRVISVEQAPLLPAWVLLLLLLGTLLWAWRLEGR